MEIQTITVNTREESGKGPARRSRVAGTIPGVIYGESQPAVPIVLDAKAFVAALHGSQGEHAIVQVDVADRPELSGPTLVKAVQHHPVKDHVIHTDLMRIRLDVPFRTLVPLRLVGQCQGIVEGGVPDQQLREVDVECLPLDTPEHIDVDVTELRIGGHLHVYDVKAPEGVTILTDPNRAVISILAPRVTAVATEAPADGKKKKK